MAYKIPSPEGAKRPRASVLYMSYCLSAHVLTSIASVDTIHLRKHQLMLLMRLLMLYTVASALCIIKLN